MAELNAESVQEHAGWRAFNGSKKLGQHNEGPECDV